MTAVLAAGCGAAVTVSTERLPDGREQRVYEVAVPSSDLARMQVSPEGLEAILREAAEQEPGWDFLGREVRGEVVVYRLSEAVSADAAGGAEPGAAPRAQASSAVAQRSAPEPRAKPAPPPPPVFPVAGDWWLSSRYGPRLDPFTGERDFHHGVDLAAAPGTPVRAYQSGRVIWAGPAVDYGLAVGIRHGDGRTTWYGHLASVAVLAGEWVERGERIGDVGSTGRSTGPHLHFEIRDPSGQRVDPWPELRLLLSRKGARQ